MNQLLFDGLTVLQHRGQDAAGIVTAEKLRLHLRKDNGLVKDVFHQHHMFELRGNVGLGHVRYPTAGSSSCAEAQPLYTNYPYGICVAHNGNLTNADELTRHLRDVVGVRVCIVPIRDVFMVEIFLVLTHESFCFSFDTFCDLDFKRHVNTDSDSELLLNVFAEALMQQRSQPNRVEAVFESVSRVMEQCKGGYSGLYLINGIGLVGFRDPHGIRPLVFGSRRSKSTQAEAEDCGVPRTPAHMASASKTLDYVMASESVAIDTLGFELIRYVSLSPCRTLLCVCLICCRGCLFSDVRAGEAIFIDMTTGNCHARVCFNETKLSPCIFEYVYFARPDSIMDGVSVHESRLRMGEKLAKKILLEHPNHGIDVVIPIPDTSRTCALQAAYTLNCPFREGFIKNRYIARTFIMPGQSTRRKSVRLKLNTIKSEFYGRNVLLVDDSIVRGTTAHEIVQMARDAGAKKVFFTSAAPPVRFPNIYGIDIPTRHELVAYGRDENEIAKIIGCDWVL